MTSAEIPNRSLFKPPEVCEIAQVQPYVLRSWEAEFPDLGVSKGAGPRVYRRADVQRVLRIKELLFVEGLTLAGARRRLEEEHAVAAESTAEAPSLTELFGADARERISEVRQGLRWILELLAGNGNAKPALFEMSPLAAGPAARARKPAPAPTPKAHKKKGRR
jgi:DNA-binding transcriptional MerR regulator